MQLSEVRRADADDVFAPARIEDWNRLNSTFEAISGYSLYDATDTAAQLPERTRYAGVGPRFLEVLGLAPALGRGFDERRAPVRGAATLLVSDRFWRNRLAADPGAPGRTVQASDVTGTLSFDRRRHAALFRVSRRRSRHLVGLKIDAPWMRSRESSCVHDGDRPPQARA